MTTDYAYDGTMLVREGHAAGGSLTPTATYFQGASGPCYRRDDTQTQTDGQGHTFGKTGWYVYDGLGSVVDEVDPLGNVTSSPKYDVYGAVRGNGGIANTKQGFVGSLGHLSEPETGLIYMQARYMDPQTGRFVSEDPAQSGCNWFVYCADNPSNKIDPTGRFGLLDFLWDTIIKALFEKLAGPVLNPILTGLGNAAETVGKAMEAEGDAIIAEGNAILGSGELRDVAGDEAGGKGQQMVGGELLEMGATEKLYGALLINAGEYLKACGD